MPKRRQPANLEPETRQAVARAARAVKSESGKALLKKRGEQIERGFAHVLDCGGLRRTTLRGRINNNKRYLCSILAFNPESHHGKTDQKGHPEAGGSPRGLLGLLSHAVRRLLMESSASPAFA